MSFITISMPVTASHVCSKRLLFVAYAQGAQAEAYTGQQSAALATQKILEWPRLCSHVAKFASTTLGRQAVLELKASILIACIRLHTAAPAGYIMTGLFSCARCSAVADRTLHLRESICMVWVFSVAVAVLQVPQAQAETDRPLAETVAMHVP